MEKRPFKTTIKTERINDYHTDIIITDYSDRLFVIVTQYEKMGTLVLVTQEVSPTDHRNILYDTNILFGREEPEVHAIARNFAEKLGATKPVLFSIALKDYSCNTIGIIAQMLCNELDVFSNNV